jgi:hypothetical protein
MPPLSWKTRATLEVPKPPKAEGYTSNVEGRDMLSAVGGIGIVGVVVVILIVLAVLYFVRGR